jgi:hypothetical protein
MNSNKIEHFAILNKIDVSDKTETKKSNSTELTYLSWAFAWGELKKNYPCAIYEVQKFNGLPYVLDPLTGYIVYTKITIENITHEMWLPVLDVANKAMKDKPYEYKTKFGTKTCEAATMFDINKTIMRCLVKNIAMFGLGLYIFAGEDLPEDSDQEQDNKKPINKQAIKIDFESYKQLLLESKNLNELRINFENCYIKKSEFTKLEYAELLNIKDNLKNNFTS